MTINDLKNLKWGSANWTNCPCDSSYTVPFVKANDIELFLSYTFREIARKASLPYDENLIKFLKEENSEFYAYFCHYTHPYYIPIPRSEYDALKNLLIIPKIDKNYTAAPNKVQRIINEFESLSDIDKLKVLEYLKLKEVIIK
ncbi:MAG: hypothetical protein IJ094_03340 [Bacilli bacterium]|nr:hypothetical protein [Bacilli bacterium]